MKSRFQVKQISTDEAKARAFPIRMRVFVREQGVPAEIELDADDGRAIHLLALASGRAVGTARIVIKRGGAKIGRMAVIKSCRKKGIGAGLLKRAVAVAKKRDRTRIHVRLDRAAKRTVVIIGERMAQMRRRPGQMRLENLQGIIDEMVEDAESELQRLNKIFMKT